MPPTTASSGRDPGSRTSRRRASRGAKVVLAALALAAAPTISPGLPAAKASSGAAVAQRLAGPDRYATAAAISAATFAPGVPVAYVATGTNYPDALAAGTAARGAGPVLLVTASDVPSPTASELRRLSPGRIVVLGGTKSVSEGVVSALNAFGAKVERVAGSDRYSTAAATSAATFAPGVPVAYVASGTTYPDALAAGAAAGGAGPILLVAPDGVPDVVAREIQRLAPRRLVVVGGPSQISSSTAAALDALIEGSVERVEGADRYSTASNLAGMAFPGQAQAAYVATGANFADALAAVPAAARAHAPLLLVPSGGVTGVTARAVAQLSPERVMVVGGQSSVSDRQADALGAPAGASVPPPSARAPEAVNVALGQLGKPYVWGGAGPDVFDCSGLVSFAWGAVGVPLTHYTGSQYQETTHVPIGARAPGDVVFFGDDLHHVGLYLGGDEMVEAPRTGIPVRRSSIWRSDLVGLGRPG